MPRAYDDRKSRAFHTPLKFQIRAFVKRPFQCMYKATLNKGGFKYCNSVLYSMGHSCLA